MDSLLPKSWTTRWGRLATAALLWSSADAMAAPGDHVRLGDTTITPELGVGMEFQSNIFLSVGEAQSGAPADRVQSGLNLRMSPRFKVVTDRPEVRFDFDGRYDLRKFLDPEIAKVRDRLTDFSAKVGLELLKTRLFGFRFDNKAALRNSASDNRYFATSLITQFRDDLTGYFITRIGPELILETGGRFAYHAIRIPGVDASVPLNKRQTFGPEMNFRWQFFPRTAFVVEASYLSNRWDQNWLVTDPTGQSTGTSQLGSFLAMPDSTFLKASTGLRGRFTESLVLGLTAGYGTATYDEQTVLDAAGGEGGSELDPVANGFGKDSQGLDGLLITALAEFDMGYDKKRKWGHKIGVRYSRDFVDSFFSNFDVVNQVKGQLKSKWGKRVTSQLGLSTRFEQFYGEVERRDIFLRADMGLTVDANDWLALDLTSYWAERASTEPTIQYDNVAVELMGTFRY